MVARLHKKTELTLYETRIVNLLVQGYKKQDIITHTQYNPSYLRNALKSILDKTHSRTLPQAIHTLHKQGFKFDD